MSCNTSKELDIQGHRGSRGLMPENSLPAFEKAIELGVTTLELDIAISKDKQIVVTHEPYMNPVICLKPDGSQISDSEEKINLYKLNYEDIKQYDCGNRFHPRFPDQEKLEVYKPLLSEVFNLAKSENSKVNFNIEIKSEPDYYGVFTPQPQEYVKLVLDEINKDDMFERVNLQSFDINILEEIKKQSPQMPVALLVDESENISEKLEQLSFKPEIISPYFKLLTSELIQKYHNKGFKIIPWTVNDEQDMIEMLRLNVDGIITDYPDRLIAILYK
ncbi:glycerophosphodiester phosphodiesterase [Winogradskyella ursingii]|uniref:glycerophosphodiester phosphodiesterase n=1 Tax=Winogradskyella ursingii TaxID=2686079 RepID=UPI0015CE9381|nr:glycerophosphodiester phosphodiesterase [Winogradskyella ursingii]